MVISIMIFLLGLFNLYYLLNFLQQAHYNFNSFSVLINKVIKDKKNYLLLFTILSILNIESFGYKLYLLLALIIICGLYIFLRIEKKLIVRLKITKRIIRLTICNIVIYGLIIIVSSMIKIFSIDFLIIILSIPLLYLSLLVTYPIELMINKRFWNKASKVINESNGLVIGITGSAGKTSTKYFLGQLLSSKYHTFITPKSFNTINGISRAINESKSKSYEIYIIEYGASKLNDIKESLKVVKPNISVITNFSFQHLETFISVENQVKEKCRIISSSNVHFCSSDNLKYYEKYNITLPKKVIIIGYDYEIRKCQYNKDYMEFVVYERKTNQECKFKTKVLGRNNATNLTFCIAILRYLGFNMQKIKYMISSCNPVENRLEVKQVKDKYLINDSFNSNKEGFLEAINVLKAFPGKRAIITPGVVTGGNEMSEINKEIAYSLVDIDEIYLVTSISSKYYKEVFNDKLVEYTEVSSFIEAYDKCINNDKVKTILIENDITDFYKG